MPASYKLWWFSRRLFSYLLSWFSSVQQDHNLTPHPEKMWKSCNQFMMLLMMTNTNMAAISRGLTCRWIFLVTQQGIYWANRVREFSPSMNSLVPKQIGNTRRVLPICFGTYDFVYCNSRITRFKGSKFLFVFIERKCLKVKDYEHGFKVMYSK